MQRLTLLQQPALVYLPPIPSFAYFTRCCCCSCRRRVLSSLLAVVIVIKVSRSVLFVLLADKGDGERTNHKILFGVVFGRRPGPGLKYEFQRGLKQKKEENANTNLEDTWRAKKHNCNE